MMSGNDGQEDGIDTGGYWGREAGWTGGWKRDREALGGRVGVAMRVERAGRSSPCGVVFTRPSNGVPPDDRRSANYMSTLLSETSPSSATTLTADPEAWSAPAEADWAAASWRRMGSK